jgi:vacuolar-type H+-ATPase subunit I/STV1
MLRIFLIVAILASVGVIVISQLQVKPHIEGIIKEREDQRQRGDTLQVQVNNTRKKLADTEKDLTTTKRTLEETQAQLTAANGKIEEQGNHLKTLQESLDKSQNELTTTKQRLAQWEGLPITPDQVKSLIKAEKDLRTANEALLSEAKIQQREYSRVNAKLKQYEGGGAEVVVDLPPLKGKILVVDPKWNFVVLNVGIKDGVLPNGVLMVSRDSKLVAKIKVTSVQQERCIANIMPGWKLSDVLEGDLVVN